ncbi:hypothetical protein NKJ71_19610 [Mesorhizobium sp. M0050]|uniref:hypothetical protein n=1 Tax=Mesorhizobium sp. M0050 TaxID=2956861 RepID=UPI00333A82EB
MTNLMASASAICAGSQVTAGKCFLFFPLVQHPQKSGRSGFHLLFFAPAFPSVPVVHANNKARSKKHGAPRNSASGA